MDGASGERAAPAFDAELALHNDAETILANTAFLLTRCSSDLRYVFASEAYARMIGHRPDELVGKKIIEVMGETGFQTILPHIKAVLTGQRVEYETDVHFKDVGPRLLHVIYTPDKDRSGHVHGWVASIIDITEKRQSEQREKLLLREIQHRSNNLLAVVQAIAHHTFSGTHSLDEAKKAFEGRLLALAQSNKQITKSVTGVSLREIIYLLVGPFADRVSAHGPDVTIGSQEAQNLSLLLHELITNAAKYGALSKTAGKVEITWVVNPLRQGVQLTWREQGGPSVANPRHAGFGTMLLKATFPNAQVDYTPEGLRYQVEVPTAKNDNSGLIYGSSVPPLNVA
jgi:PAS domain S-box-containing protein